MNLLEQWIKKNDKFDDVTMNRLQEAGIVSDEAIHASDVADSDCEKAIRFLENNP